MGDLVPFFRLNVLPFLVLYPKPWEAKAMIKHMARKRLAGNDLIKGSPILKCIVIEPVSRIARPVAAGNFNSGYQMPAMSRMARMTFKAPTV